MSRKYEKLKTLLKELFQLDQPDLDFGLYRVLHAKSAEVSQFLDNDLLPQVRTAFGQYKTADKAEIENSLATAIKQAEGLGVDPETTQRVKDLRAQLKSDAVDIDALQSEVYDHLFSFFRRYYSEGDFLARRVYKPGVYAIPYEGEEVTLHWANKDQYYIKTTEYLRDYAFRLRPEDDKKSMRVHFRLADAAEGEHGNVKAAQGKDRVFILAAPGESGHDFIAEEDGEQGKELVIHFEYRPATLTDWPEEERAVKKKPPGQKDLSALAAKRILTVADAALMPWLAELGKQHVMASGERADYSRLVAHLGRYTARNTFDYFIHKDLGTFLRQELDFYIKNEVMHLDDMENESAPRVEQYLSKIKVIRKIAGKIIDFLAQLEDFQKKLWLKKKFVVETQYCITVGTIPEAFYPEIAENEAQREEWVTLFANDQIEGSLTTSGYSKQLKPEFLTAHPTLLVNTQFFSSHFTERLLDVLGDIDHQTDGLLFHGENFQALSLMQAKYREQVKCIYIDPPYNTGSDEFVYRDNLRHSSWLSLMADRMTYSRELMASDSAIFVTIDDTESQHLRILLELIFGVMDFVTSIAWQKKVSPSNDAKWFSSDHDHILVAAKSKSRWQPDRLAMNDRQKSYYRNPDGDPRGPWNSSTYTCNKSRRERPNLYYPITCPSTGEEVWPSETAVWAYSREVHQQHVAQNLLYWGRDGKASKPRFKKLLSEAKAVVPRTIWPYAEVGHTQSAAQVLGNVMPGSGFQTPKPPALIERMLALTTGVDRNALVLDYFAGSGTTGHAVINTNQRDGGQRKFILVEMGDYFDTVLLPRIKRITYTPKWKDGKVERLATPEEAERSPRIVKVVRLESYEDTLNNLETGRTDKQQLLLDAAEAQGTDGLKEQYILRYMLDVETRGSQSLLHVQAFTDPTAYKLKVKRPGSDESREVNVDLLETFNWLIGVTVRHIAAPQTFSAAFERDSEKRLRLKGRLKQEADGPYWFRTVTGATPDGRRTLVIWRRLSGEPEQDNLVLDEWFTRQGYSAKDSEFDLIYVNGGNNLENLKALDDLWKVRLIEEDFHRLMFEMEGE